MRKRKIPPRKITDDWAISQDELPYFDMDLYNEYQFIQNEKVPSHWNPNRPNITRYTPCRIPCPNTLTATIYNDGVAIQTLIANKDGTITLNTIQRSVAYVKTGKICHITGEIALEWEGVPGLSDGIVASYEYSLSRNTLHNGSSLCTSEKC